MFEPAILQWLIPVATVAAAWGGSRQALNGTRERVKSIETKLDKHIEDEAVWHTDVASRIAVLEVRAEDR